MLKTLKFVGVLVLMSAVLSAQEAAVPKELAPYQGTWVATLINGEAPPVEIVLIVKGTKYENLVNGQMAETGTLKFDLTKKPVWFDLSIETGDDAGKLQLGLIQVTGDNAVIKLTVPGSTTRPTSLDPDQDGFIVQAERRK